MGLTAELYDDVAGLEPHRAGWDRLAVAAGRPYCAPAWMLSWWREVAPRDGCLRVIVVRQGDEPAAILPLWARPEDGRYGLLAERTSSPVEPLAAPGMEAEAAAACAPVLAGADPRPRVVELSGLPAGSPWPRLLCDALPAAPAGGPATTRSERVPTVTLGHDGVEEWLSSRSRNFRQQVRRSRRRLADEGALFRLATLAELDGDVEALARLHHSRWEPRGGSGALDERVEALLRRAGRELIPSGRFRLWSIEVNGRPVSSHLFVAAGARLSYWLGGFDGEWASRHPSILALVAAIGHGIEQGEDLLELGPGAQPYKLRLADSEDGLTWASFALGGG